MWRAIESRIPGPTKSDAGALRMNIGNSSGVIFTFPILLLSRSQGGNAPCCLYGDRRALSAR